MLFENLKYPFLTVLGKLPARKIAPSTNSNANPKPNPDLDRGTIFLGRNFRDTFFNICPSKIPNVTRGPFIR